MNLRSCRPPGPYTAELHGNWSAAAKEWEDLGCPYDTALALFPGDAAAVGQALTIFESLGARPAAARARARLRTLGVRYGDRGPRPTTRANQHYVTDDLQRAFFLYDASSPEAIRKAARRTGLTVEVIHRVNTLDAHPYPHRRPAPAARTSIVAGSSTAPGCSAVLLVPA